MADKPKRQYPHVGSVKDVDTQRSLRLLWDLVYDQVDKIKAHDDRLSTTEKTVSTQGETIDDHDKKVRQALITAGLTPEEIAALFP